MFVIALAITGFSVPWIRRLAIAIGFVDAPAARKLHASPMPLMGGLGIVLGAALAVFVIFPDAAAQVRGILLAAAVVAAVGLADDRYHLPAWAKLAGQFVGFLILIYFSVHVRLPLPLWLNYAVTFVWLAGISNAINFLDNMDGLSAGVSGVAAAFILLLGALNNQYLVSALAAAVLGACLGFLRYNFKPAQIFMGDAGALFLGFLLAVLALQLRFPDNINYVTWMAPVFIMGLPIFDTSLVIVSRLRRRVNPFTTAGKDHISHRLVDLGFTQREAVLILYLVTGASGMAAIFISKADIVEAYGLAAVTAALALAAIIWLERVKSSNKERVEWQNEPNQVTK
jgi:UDP-GlcNAc:undecaprenyl-phosphate GlcNAc-1-phosphate transferase